MKILGKTVKKDVAPGSKSQHDAVVIVVEESDFILRPSGGTPFVDPEREKLVGKNLHAFPALSPDEFTVMDSRCRKF